MLVATFNETTGWAGRTITFVNGSFLLEGHGVLRASDVASYDAHGQLTWVRGDLREWVRQLSGADAARAAGTTWQGAATHRSLPAWAIVLLVLGGLLAAGIIASIAIPMVMLQQERAQGGTATYTNTAAGYRIEYPARFTRRPYTTGIGDPDLSVRFFDPRGIFAVAKGELATTVILAVSRMDGPLTDAEASRVARELVNGYPTQPTDHPESGIWDQRTVRAETGRFHGWPCAIYEFTYRTKYGGRQHDIAYSFCIDAKSYYLQLGCGESSWGATRPTLQKIADSFATL